MVKTKLPSISKISYHCAEFTLDAIMFCIVLPFNIVSVICGDGVLVDQNFFGHKLKADRLRWGKPSYGSSWYSRDD